MFIVGGLIYDANRSSFMITSGVVIEDCRQRRQALLAP